MVCGVSCLQRQASAWDIFTTGEAGLSPQLIEKTNGVLGSWLFHTWKSITVFLGRSLSTTLHSSVECQAHYSFFIRMPLPSPPLPSSSPMFYLTYSRHPFYSSFRSLTNLNQNWGRMTSGNSLSPTPSRELHFRCYGRCVWVFLRSSFSDTVVDGNTDAGGGGGSLRLFQCYKCATWGRTPGLCGIWMGDTHFHFQAAGCLRFQTPPFHPAEETLWAFCCSAVRGRDSELLVYWGPRIQ